MPSHTSIDSTLECPGGGCQQPGRAARMALAAGFAVGLSAASASLRAPLRGLPMRLWLSLTFLVLVPDLAHADEFERSVPVARAVDEELAHPEVVPDPPQDPGEPGDAHFARTLEARVGAVLDQSVDLAAERAVALLEAREAERLDEVARSAARRVEQQLVSAPAREVRRGRFEDELAVPPGVRTGEPTSKASRLVSAAEPRWLAAPGEEAISPPLELVAHEGGEEVSRGRGPAPCLDRPGPERVCHGRVAQLVRCAVDLDPVEVGSPPW